MNNGDNNINNTNTTNTVVPNTGVGTNTTPVTTEATPAVTSTVTSSVEATQAVDTTAPTIVTAENVVANNQIKEDENDKKKKKKKNPNQSSGSPLTILFFLLAVGLGFYCFYSGKLYKTNLNNLKYNCVPVNSSKEDKQLPLDSTLVVELYDKVATSIREDYAQPYFDDNMKLYLAFRQIPDYKFYNSNCNMYNPNRMEPYYCDQKTFTPKAFKEEDLLHELKMLYGEETKIPLADIKLQNSCIGGYQYIPERGEFVEGKCDQQTAVSYKVTKTLKEAYTNRNTITIVEEVTYREGEKMKLPEYLKDGTYIYTFRLDMNFNYVLVDRRYESKY